MFVQASGLQLKIESSYTNNTSFVESTSINPADTQNRILGVGDLTQHRHPLNRKVFKFVHATLKVVLHMCLLG